MYNMLTDPLIRMDTSGSARTEASLPEVYATLMADKVDAFPALRPHQRHAWHAFLVQLGAMAMHRAGVSEPPEESEEWADLIRGLTPDYPDDEPWRLVVEDVTKPAFMQPPASSKDKAADYEDTVESPDELDMLVTSRNHDLKTRMALSSEIDDWIFALISLQTMEGFSGAGNYGISRMNGGMGNRPAFSLTPSTRPGAHARRDIVVLTDRREDLSNDSEMYDEHGIGLLWTRPWNGTGAEALLPKALDPFYIEVCRRVRLRHNDEERLQAIRATSKAARIESKALKGMTGDPWTPVNKKDGKSLTLASVGFRYDLIVKYLTSGDWEKPLLLETTASERRSPDTMQLVARGMVRGQGKTEGYYERTIPVRKKLKAAMMRSSAPDMDDIGKIASERIIEIGKVEGILSHAIQTFLARGDTGKVSPERRKLADPWRKRLDDIVDAKFFADLQDEFEADEAEQERIRNQWLMNWKDGVIDHARRILSEAEDSLPCPAIDRYKARVGAEGLFEGRMRGEKGFPSLSWQKGDEDDD